MTRRLPADLKAARGTLRQSREARQPPPRLHGVPKPPKHLQGAGLEFWKLVTKILASRHQLGLDSAPALTALCEVFKERADLAEILEKEGRLQWVTTTKDERIRKPHPAVAMFRDADARYRSWLGEFGLTDASRGKVDAVYIQPIAPKPKKAKGAPTKPGERYGLA